MKKPNSSAGPGGTGSREKACLERLDRLLTSPRGVLASPALFRLRQALEEQLRQRPDATPPPELGCPGQKPVICGNGHEGQGTPGERQVNDPQQDAVAGGRITQSETSLAASGSNILFGFNDSNCSLFGNFSGFAFSSDGGVTWSDCGSMPKRIDIQNGGDPVIAVDCRGVFYYAHLGQLGPTEVGEGPQTKQDEAERESYVMINTATVLQDRRLRMNLPSVFLGGAFPEGFQDKPWITVGPDRSHPGNQAVYVAWTDFKDIIDSIRFAKLSTDETPDVLIGEKDIASAELGTGNDVSGAFVVTDQQGNIYVFFNDRAAPIGSISLVRSTDGGETFLLPETVSPVTVAATNIARCNRENRPVIYVGPGRAIRNTEFPAAAVGPDGTLYVVWNDGVNLDVTGSIDIYLAYSTDQGENWEVVQITNGPTHAFMPAVAADQNGAHVQYSRFGGDQGVGDGTFALFMKTFSIEDGVGEESMISSVFSQVPLNQPDNFDPAVAGCYMGDYNQIITGPGLSLLHSWSDNRNGPDGKNPDVFFIQTASRPVDGQ